MKKEKNTFELLEISGNLWNGLLFVAINKLKSSVFIIYSIYSISVSTLYGNSVIITVFNSLCNITFALWTGQTNVVKEYESRQNLNVINVSFKKMSSWDLLLEFWECV